MRYPVEITVTNKRTDYRDMRSTDDVPETREDTNKYHGYMEIKRKEIAIHYIEAFNRAFMLSTSVFQYGDVVVINHFGSFNTSLVFRNGGSCDCAYDAGYFTMMLRVNTQRLESNLCKLGGKIEMEYTLEVMGNLAERNVMSLSVYPLESAS